MGMDRHIKTADQCELHLGELQKLKSCVCFNFSFKCPYVWKLSLVNMWL